MDNDQLEILVGLIFASGRLERRPQQDHWGYCAVFSGSPGAEDFMEEKLSEFKKAIPTNAGIHSYVAYRSQREPHEGGVRSTQSRALRFRIRSPQLEIAWNLLYPNGFKEVTPVLLEMLSQRAAAWHWAENALPHRYGIQLKRVGETREEAELVRLWIKSMTGAHGTVVRETKDPRIIFEGPEEAQIRHALAPYAPFTRRSKFR